MPSASLERSGSPLLKIAKPVTWLGREPECDIVFDASSGTVSRRHASIKVDGRDYLLIDNNSFNGTLVNEQRISGEVPLFDGDAIRLGMGGPIIKFVCPGRTAPAGADLAAQRSSHSINIPADGSPKTVVETRQNAVGTAANGTSQPQMLMSVAFDERNKIKIGRDKTNDIQLDGLQMSKFHAKIMRSGSEYLVEDSGSTNGVFVNGARITKQPAGRMTRSRSVLFAQGRSRGERQCLRYTVENAGRLREYHTRGAEPIGRRQDKVA